MIASRHLIAVAMTSVLAAAACGGGGESAPGSSGAGPTAAQGTVAVDKNAYPVFPDADAGADPAVPAEQGGKGFTGQGWQTSTDFDLIGDPRAVKGGLFRDVSLEFPGTLRIYGPETNIINYKLETMVYESLLNLHPTTLQYLPGLATHWQISDDKLTYRFRLDPNARFSDGSPVVADDVVASWDFVMDKSIQEAPRRTMLEKFERPVAESKYIVRVKSTELKWMNFYNIAGFLPVMPAKALKGLTGDHYLKDFNFKLPPGSGPYIVRDEDVVKGKSVSIRRRKDYWAEKHRRNVGIWNFDEVRWIVVRDQRLQLEMMKKGDLDYYHVNISREWVEETNFDKIQRGLIQKRKIFTDYPSNIQGIALNLRREPFNDVRVRRALILLLNRELLIKTLFFNEYLPMNSHFPGGIYENPGNPKNAYDPKTAVDLLAEAGWKSRDAQGRLVKDGKPLSIEYMYADKGSERWLTVYQDDLRKVGITLNLRLLSGETMVQMRGEFNFGMVSMGWVQGTFPDPESVYRSDFADVKHSFNYIGFKDPKVDDLIKRYNAEFDQTKRVGLLREMDAVLAAQYIDILEWEAPFSRIIYLNKFGQPPGYFSRIGDYLDMPQYWWVDPAKEQAFNAAMADPSGKMEVGTTDVRYWKDFAARGGTAFEPPK